MNGHRTPPDLILFDLDGTISDPSAGFVRAINYALKHFGYPEMTTASLLPYIGPPLDQTLRSLTKENSSAKIGDLVARYREYYADTGYTENTVYAGIPEVLATLTAAQLPLAVCTSKRADFAERILEMFNLRHHFAFVSGGDVGIDKTQQIAELVSQGAVTASSIMVGDRAVDLLAAHHNGLESAGVLWGYGSRAELKAEHPAAIFEHPTDIVCLAG